MQRGPVPRSLSLAPSALGPDHPGSPHLTARSAPPGAQEFKVTDIRTGFEVLPRPCDSPCMLAPAHCGPPAGLGHSSLSSRVPWTSVSRQHRSPHSSLPGVSGRVMKWLHSHVHLSSWATAPRRQGACLFLHSSVPRLSTGGGAGHRREAEELGGAPTSPEDPDRRSPETPGEREGRGSGNLVTPLQEFGETLGLGVPVREVASTSSVTSQRPRCAAVTACDVEVHLMGDGAALGTAEA